MYLQNHQAITSVPTNLPQSIPSARSRNDNRNPYAREARVSGRGVGVGVTPRGVGPLAWLLSELRLHRIFGDRCRKGFASTIEPKNWYTIPPSHPHREWEGADTLVKKKVSSGKQPPG